LTSHEKDQLNIARIEMSAYGSLLVNGEKERVKPVYAHRVNLNVSQSHQICSIMKDSTISPEEKEERSRRLIQDSGIDIPPHIYYISDRCRVFTVRKGIVKAMGYVDRDGYSIVTLYDTNGKRHHFKRGQLARITFEGLPLVPGDCTIHHKNYRRRDDSLGNTSFTHISLNAADKGPRLHPSDQEMNQEQREQQEEAAVERENRRLLMIRLNKLLRPLSPADQARVHNAINGAGPNDQILSRHGRESVTRGSMRRLRPGIWLDDLSINYYLKNCLAMRDVQLCATQPGRKRSHFFNSFFIDAMFSNENNGNYNYANVNTYFRHVPGQNIFNLRYLVCPINIDNGHWTAIIVFMEKKEIRYYDSLGGTDLDKLDGVLNYLCDEHHRMTGEFLDTDEWELFECTDNVPRQLNGKCVTMLFFFLLYTHY